MDNRSIAQKIVDLLNADAGVAQLDGQVRQDGWKLHKGRRQTVKLCIGCGTEFSPDCKHRQYCSRACWLADPAKGRTKNYEG